MSRVVVLADDAKVSTSASAEDTLLNLKVIGRNPNVRLEVDVEVCSAHPAKDALIELDVLVTARFHREACRQVERRS